MNNLQTLSDYQMTQPLLRISEDLINDYEAHIDLTPTTKKTYIYCLNKFINWVINNQISVVTSDTIIEFKHYLKYELKQKNASINKYLTAIKSLYNWLEDKGYKNITRNIKKERVDKGFSKDSMSLDQVKRILNNINLNNYEGIRANALFRLLIGTGLRECEVVRADVKDLSTKGNVNVLFIQGKGRSDKKDFVIIKDSVMDAIQTYLRVRGAKPNEPLFVSTSNNSKGKRLTTRTIQRIIKKLYEDNGIISERITTHCTRHTAITIGVYSGGRLEKAQEMARHKNLDTTLIYYHDLTRLEDNLETYIDNAINGSEVLS